MSESMHPIGKRKDSRNFDLYLNLVGGVVVLFCVFVVGFYAGKLWGGEKTSKEEPFYELINTGLPWLDSGEGTSNDSSTQLDFNLFWDIWDTLKTMYVDEDISQEDLYYGAIKGMVAGVGDPVTIFLTPEETELYDQGNEGVFEGIGAELGYEDGSIIIVSPLEGSPALAAGLRAGDRIIKVDGEETSGKNIYQVVSEIRGDQGTTVVVTVQRDGDLELKDITVIRGEITVPSITYEGMTDGVSVIDVDRFTEASLPAWQSRWDDIIAEVVADAPTTVILDLRGNPGGYFNAAIWAASDFLPAGTLVSQQYDRNESATDFTVTREGKLLDVELIVLVDGASASASEILAGALQHYDRAYILGENTYGKGTAQRVLEYSDGSSLHITTLRWLLPDGHGLDKDHVIVPDQIVEFTQDDFTDGEDPQMDAALEYIN